jgi:DNA mismatch repair protein MutL
VRDLFFNIPARRKFLKAESTELSHIASLVTHYALAHPEMHWELHSATNAMLIAPPVADHSQRIYQVFGKETLDQLIALSALLPLERVGLPQPPPWRRSEVEELRRAGEGRMKLHGFVSRPEIQKLNRNSIFIFVNGRLIRDRLVQHALTEAYRNINPPTVYPVVLLFLEMPATEVDVNVHPSKTEVRFRQQTVVHDFVRDAVRDALMKARPVPQFLAEINAQPSASAGLTPGARGGNSGQGAWRSLYEPAQDGLGSAQNEATDAIAQPGFALQQPQIAPSTARFAFEGGVAVEANAAVSLARAPEAAVPDHGCAPPIDAEAQSTPTLESLRTLKPLWARFANSFILAVNDEGLWIIDQHVAHERVLFEKILRQRAAQKVESQRLLMPLVHRTDTRAASGV